MTFPVGEDGALVRMSVLGGGIYGTTLSGGVEVHGSGGYCAGMTGATAFEMTTGCRLAGGDVGELNGYLPSLPTSNVSADAQTHSPLIPRNSISSRDISNSLGLFTSVSGSGE